MKYASFLADGPAASALGLGLWPLTGAMGPVDIEEAKSTLAAAIDHGITFFDASRNAPLSEELLGRAVKGERRSQVIVATKAYPGDGIDGLRAAVDKSLRALDTDYIDIFQLQGWYAQMPIEKVIIDGQALIAEGKIRHLGVCNFDASVLTAASHGGAIASNALEHNLLQRSAEAEDLRACAEHGVKVIAHSALAKGLLSGRYRAGHQFDGEDERAQFSDVRERLASGQLDRLVALAEEVGRPLPELAIAWLLSRPEISVTLVGAKRPEQVAQNCLAVERALDDALMSRVDRITAAADPT